MKNNTQKEKLKSLVKQCLNEISGAPRDTSRELYELQMMVNSISKALHNIKYDASDEEIKVTLKRIVNQCDELRQEIRNSFNV